MGLRSVSLRCLALLTALYGNSLFAQGAAVVASGYTLPVTEVAPGELITITVGGLEKLTTSYITTATPPLPLTLGGVSVTLRQTAELPLDLPVPLLTLSQSDGCGGYFFDAAANCLATAITLEIPYEMAQFHPDLAGTVDRAWLIVHQNGKDAVPFRITAVTDHIHVLTECDHFLFPWFGASTRIPAMSSYGYTR